jgi:hypothetical protein
MAEAFFQATAWTMDTPKPYGAFHLVLTVLGVSLSIFLARKFSFSGKKSRTGYHSFFMRLIFRADRII